MSSPDAPVTAPQPSSLLDRFLRIFADVRAGEGLRAVILMITLFIILSAYYVLKTARQGLLAGGGTFGIAPDEIATYAGGAMALLMLGIIPAYGRLVSRVSRKRLLDISYAIVIGCLAVFFVLGNAGVPVGLPFYVWLGIVNMFVIAQFWSFANDLYTEDQGKRLFAIIAIGGTTGAIAGPPLSKLAGTNAMMGIAAGMFLVALVLLGIVDAMSKRRSRGEAHAADEPVEKSGGFQLVLRDRYLLLIALMMVATNMINTTGEYVLANAIDERVAELVQPAAFGSEEAYTKARVEARKEQYADFFFWVNVVGFLIQSLLASRIIKYLGIRRALLILPIIAFSGYGLIGAVGTFALLRVAKVAENATDYSLQNTVRQSLFLPTSREVKYKAKAAIDTFFVRFGDTAAAILVAVSIHSLGLGRVELAFANVAIASVWIGLAIAIGRHFDRRSRDQAASR